MICFLLFLEILWNCSLKFFLDWKIRVCTVIFSMIFYCLTTTVLLVSLDRIFVSFFNDERQKNIVSDKATYKNRSSKNYMATLHCTVRWCSYILRDGGSRPSSIYSCSIDHILEHEFCHLVCWAVSEKFLKRRNFCLSMLLFLGGFFNFLRSNKKN